MAKTQRKSQSKEISEKTFELNITNELLNISKSFLWYLHYCHPLYLLNASDWQDFLKQSVLFAEGLTQDQESKTGGGYDVAIRSNHPTYGSGRLLFLQFKSGKRVSYCRDIKSHFNSQISQSQTNEHVMFTFNDAAKKTQHSILRNLLNDKTIQPKSVMYVFPRITEKSDFYNKVGNLVQNSSFISVLDIEQQARTQTPPIIIKDEETHKFRTSYNGLKSEVNSERFDYNYENQDLLKLLGEMICVQIERFFRMLKKEGRFNEELHKQSNIIISEIEEAIDFSLSAYLNSFIVGRIMDDVHDYLNSLRRSLIENEIPAAPSNYTTTIPKEGLKLNYEYAAEYDSISYQIF